MLIKFDKDDHFFQDDRSSQQNGSKWGEISDDIVWYVIKMDDDSETCLVQKGSMLHYINMKLMR